MPMMNLGSNKLKASADKVFKEGTVKSKKDNDLPADLVAKAIVEIAAISNGPQADMLVLLRNTMINMPINPDVLGKLSVEAKEALLETDGRMSLHGQNVLQDTLQEPLLGQSGALSFDPQHYIKQYNEKACSHGIIVRFNGREGKFQTGSRHIK